MSEAIVFPYTFDERKPVFLNPALIVPEYYTDSESQRPKAFFSGDGGVVLKNKR